MSRTLNADVTSYTYATDSNRLLEVVTASLTRDMFYDANGSLTMDRRGSKKNDPATDYAYNAAGRMESVDHHTGGTAAYTYDAFGRKRSIVEAGATTRLFYGPAGTLLEESDATGTPGRGYLRVAGRPLAAVTAAGDLQWVLSDQVGQPQKLLDASATLLWDRVAHPFGDTYAQVTGSETDEPQRFPGQRFEQLTGLHYNYFRDYDPSLGRYIQSDPVGLNGGMNGYLYAKANPYKYIDPTGEVAIADDVVLLLLLAGACVATDCIDTLAEILDFAAESCIEGVKNLIALWNESSESDDNEDPKTTLDDVAPLHDEDSLKKSSRDYFKNKSDEELLDEINNPSDPGEKVKIREDGTVVQGNHRITEAKERAKDPNSSITGETEIDAEVYRPDNSEIPDF